MLSSSPYQAYIQNSVLGGNPAELVIALYERAMEAIGQAKQCFQKDDIWGRSKAISKAHGIVTELSISVEDNKDAALRHNLRRLYAYLQFRLLDAHLKKTREPLDEVERLLGTLLEGWRSVAAKNRELERVARAGQQNFSHSATEPEERVLTAYGAYFQETADPFGRAAFTF